MDEVSDKRPSAALINREWYAAASKVLDGNQMGRLLMAVVNYVWTGDQDIELDEPSGIVFEMVRPWLDSDIDSYRRRCERNAANARSRKEPVAASGTQSQRVASNPNPNNNPNSNPNPNLSIESADPREIEKEKWLIYGYFWASGSKNVLQEMLAFWNYYDSLGWKNNKGAAIVNRLSAARMWRRQFETGNAPTGSMEWFTIVRFCPVKDLRLWDCYAGAEIIDGSVTIRLRATGKFIAELKEAMPTLEPSLKSLLKVSELTLVPLQGVS